MYLYFNENGILKEIINDKALRKGNANANVIYAYFQGDPEITTLTFNITPNGYQEAIILNQDNDSPISDLEIPYDSERKLKYFKYFTPYKFYKCTLTAETLANSGLWLMTLLAINSGQEQVAQGTYVGMVEDNNLAVDSTITYSQYSFLLGLVGSKVGMSELANYQPTLIAGNNIAINDNVISVYDVEGLIAYVDLSDSENEITQEQIDLLNQNKLNYILVNGVRYNYAQENEYVYIDDTQVSKITIDTSELTWSESSYDLQDIEYQSIDIRNDIQLGITTQVAQQTNAKVIVSSNQLIITIRAYGTATSVPNGIILDDYALPSGIANRITKLYNSNHICYGTSIVNFGGTYYQDIVELLWSGNWVYINYLTTHEASLESKNITLDIRVVVDLQ